MSDFSSIQLSTAAELWQSPALIPVLLMVVKERLSQWEKQCYSRPEKMITSAPLTPAPDQEISCYRALCQRWKQTQLNKRQRQWVQEIETCLQGYNSR